MNTIFSKILVTGVKRKIAGDCVARWHSGKIDFSAFKVEANHTTVEDFVSGLDHIDLTAFHASFDALIGNHPGHPGHGGDAGGITLTTEGHDSVLTSLRIVDVAHMHASDFLF